MTYSKQPRPITTSNLMIALNEVFPDSTYGSIPVIDQYDALEAYRAYADGGLAEVPKALEAYLSHLQHSTV